MHSRFHFSTPAVFTDFDFTAKAKPNKEWKSESMGNGPKWPKSRNKDIANHWRYHMIL